MALTDTRIRNAKPTAKPYKLSDGGGLYVIITPDEARYWRMDYRFAGKRRTLAIGIYPIVTLAAARTRREEARALLAKNMDPSAAKKAAKHAAKLAHENTFEAVAREWIGKQQRRLAPKYSALLLARFEADIFPQIGARPVTDIDAPELLQALRKVEKRGVIETARRLRSDLRSSIPLRDCDRTLPRRIPPLPCEAHSVLLEDHEVTRLCRLGKCRISFGRLKPMTVTHERA